VRCTADPSTRETCCDYPNPAFGQPGQKQFNEHCTDFLTIDPFGESPSRQPLHLTGEATMQHGNHCSPRCECNATPPTLDHPDGSRTNVQPAGGTGQRLCWGIAGGRTTGLAPGATQVINVQIENYTWLKPKRMAMTAFDEAGTDVNPARFVRVVSVEGVGRQVIGSAAGINMSSVDTQSENYLMFADSVSAINAGNTIRVSVRNDHPALTLTVDADIEGNAQQ